MTPNSGHGGTVIWTPVQLVLIASGHFRSLELIETQGIFLLYLHWPILVCLIVGTRPFSLALSTQRNSQMEGFDVHTLKTWRLILSQSHIAWDFYEKHADWQSNHFIKFL